MTDLKNPSIIIAKGFLFLGLGLLASTLLLLEAWNIKVLLLLVASVWAFCRFYYFAFYVIENYVDPQYRFAGLWSLFRYLLRRR
jgi:hypothetical protein